ncbi:CapA family protein [Streptomyces sp. V3I7]|uniref:CapA family protein n=1 Tax=Streptomyces sp. V3I7 TaxID=3042278 RepID=UPI0027886821|nr:CapA family protein [Streptomyces sp. V3I7]MDQ0994629.1 poly-gamma-glutamate capsule biosynthesis protein CapA/YwtB (metallophosphatase superfamily) [Streptomyces sp. V3I7]
MSGGTVTLFLCGDVMLGRGVDQILAHPGDPALREGYVGDARGYVRAAESANGPIPAPVDPAWPWGEALRVLDEAGPDVRIVNLETSVTRSDAFAPGKAVHYRMHPANLPALLAVRPDVCVLANNHVLDFGRTGLAETLDTLGGAGLRTAGAGHDAAQAQAPAVVPVASQDGGAGARVLVFALGSSCSGIPSDWAADAERSGVAYVPALTASAADAVLERVRRAKRPGDVVVVSVHWGSNWGYRVPDRQVRFAHALVDGGVDVVHGHSSHHPRPVEVYRERLILHGCGDFVDDYEGIAGYENYRDDLRLAFLVSVEADTGRLEGVRMVPLRARRMRLEPVPDADRDWLRATLERVSGGVSVGVADDGALTLLTPEIHPRWSHPLERHPR